MSGDCGAVLLAAGSSRRLGFDKILTPLAGRPAFRYAFDVLMACPEVAEIILVTREDLIHPIEELLPKDTGTVSVQVVAGGRERQDSVLAGLQAGRDDLHLALIHDAARPLLTPDLVAKVAEVARRHGAAICGRPCADTLKHTSDGSVIDHTIDRSKVWQVETPQIFHRPLIRQAYEEVAAKSLAITDDASALERLGHPVQLVESTAINLKITRQADWDLLKMWLSKQTENQDGSVAHTPSEPDAALSEIRSLLHAANNSMMPLSGYLPFLDKHRSNDERFHHYLAAIQEGAKLTQQHLKTAHHRLRELLHRK